MNLRDLHYAVAIADTGSFKSAADFRHVSQPTLSIQIKKLEGELGLDLFERTNKHVMLTDAGRRIVEAARHLIDCENQIREIARAARDPGAGEFRLGAIPTLASYVLPAFAPVITRSFPKLQLMLYEDKTERLLCEVKQGRLDAALLALPAHDAALTSAHLFDDPFLLAVNAKHALASRKVVRLDDLAGLKLLLLDEGHCLREQALSLCHENDASENATFRATSIETLRLMVSTHRDFITLMPNVARSKHDKLRYIRFAGKQPARRVGLVWRNTSPRASFIQQLRHLLARN